MKLLIFLNLLSKHFYFFFFSSFFKVMLQNEKLQENTFCTMNKTSVISIAGLLLRAPLLCRLQDYKIMGDE